MFAQSPAKDYFGVAHYEHWFITAFDLACSVAVWEDENFKYSEASKKAGNEASALDDAFNELRKQQEDR